VQHLAAKLRIGGLDGNIDRSQFKADDPLDIFFLQIRKGHIISLEKGQSGIIILKIQCFPHSRRHLVNKAENALVAAGSVLAHKSVFKRKSQILIIVFNVKLPLFSVSLSHRHKHGRTVYIVFIIEYILYGISVDRKDTVSRLQLQFFANGTRIYL